MRLKRLLYLVGLLMCCSCGDMLDVEPEIAVTYTNYFQNEQDVHKTYIDMYAKIREVYFQYQLQPHHKMGLVYDQCNEYYSYANELKSLSVEAFKKVAGTSWILHYNVIFQSNLILDNLIAAKKAVPMLIVMDNGYATRPSEQTPFQTTVFEEVLMQEVIPMIDEKFRTLPNRESRAIAGLSMGANQTMRIAMNYPEAFAYYGGFSGTSNYPSTEPLDADTFLGGKFKDGKAVNRQFKSFFLGLGTSEPAPFPGVVKAFRQMLDKQGIKYTYYESPETAHEWLTWRRALHQYAQLLFQ